MKSFASDNYSGVLPQIMEALNRANIDHARSYGKDETTALATKCFENELGNDIRVTFVFNGTGANVLGLGTVTQSYHSILCAKSSHLFVDESTAPESFTGCRLIPLETNEFGKIEPSTIEHAIIRKEDEHHPQVHVLTLSQPTEYGTVYSIEELKAIGTVLKRHQILFHIDGARIFNAMSTLGCPMRAISKDIGADILSVGGTKVGMMFGEALVFFDSNKSSILKYKQKQSMQLASKMRFISAQFLALWNDNLWLQSASHSNKMAILLEQKLIETSAVQITKPVQSNAVFAIIPTNWIEPLQEKFPFYVWNEKTNEVRWMCSFDTKESEIEDFVAEIKKLNAK